MLLSRVPQRVWPALRSRGHHVGEHTVYTAARGMAGAKTFSLRILTACPPAVAARPVVDDRRTEFSRRKSRFTPAAIALPGPGGRRFITLRHHRRLTPAPPSIRGVLHDDRGGDDRRRR